VPEPGLLPGNVFLTAGGGPPATAPTTGSDQPSQVERQPNEQPSAAADDQGDDGDGDSGASGPSDGDGADDGGGGGSSGSG
jgi:hypothetical protein